MSAKLARAFAVLVALAAPQAALATTYTPGNYLISSYYVSDKGSQGTTCIIPAGTYLTSIYSYPGPNKAGATSRVSLNGPTGNYVWLLNFPTTPPVGATTWSGNVTETILPGGQPVTVTFSSTFTMVDSKSYVATTTYVTPVAGGTCTAVVQELGIWTAK